MAISVVELVEETARANDIARVTLVRMRVGRMAGVVPDSLTFCFDAASRGTLAEGARLEVTLVELVGRCAACGTESRLEPYHLVCPRCDSGAVSLLSGDELHVDELEGE